MRARADLEPLEGTDEGDRGTGLAHLGLGSGDETSRLHQRQEVHILQLIEKRAFLAVARKLHLARKVCIYRRRVALLESVMVDSILNADYA